MPDTEKQIPSIPESKIVTPKRGRFSAVWIIPIVAALIGIWIGVNTIRNQGPKVTILFKSAEGLEAGKTKIRYNGIDVGEISAVRLSDDHLKVVATAKMSPKTENFLVTDTKFWVVRPQISGANITGLGTLISGAYVGVEIGQSKERARDFVALDDAPMETGGVHGRFFTLKTPELGSLNKGTPLYFRRLQCGQVASYEMDKDGKALSVKVFVEAPYDQYVTPNTRFWEASGLDVSLSASGLRVQTESFLSILVGGVAFETPASGPVLPPAEADTTFTLFKDREAAFRRPAVDPQTYVIVFKQSVRGLTVGAPVEFEGITIGEVTDIQAQFDAQTYQFSVPVTVQIDPGRFGVRMVGLSAAIAASYDRKKVMDTLVGRGLRAQLQTGSLVTGAKYVGLDFASDVPPASIDWSQNPAQVPALPGQMESMEAKLGSILQKVDQMEFKGISDDLRKAIGDLDQTLVGARGTLTNTDKLLGSANKLFTNADKLTEPNSVLVEGLDRTLQDMSEAAQSLRVLLDYLERHPEALIRGKTRESK